MAYKKRNPDTKGENLDSRGVGLSWDDWDILEAIAPEFGLSKNGLIVYAVETFLANSGCSKDTESGRARRAAILASIPREEQEGAK